MKSIGIVCEYNPFHKGHEYHIAASRAALGKKAAVVCVMSGDFVQRGEAAMCAKHARAEAACRCGADLVFELPLNWCISSAEGFARGSVGMLSALGVDYLSFGSEAGALEPLRTVAELLTDPALTNQIKNLMAADASLSFAYARQKAVQAQLGDTAAILESPNNILGVEYLKAIMELDSNIEPYTIRRSGSRHDKSGGEMRSAMELRGMLRADESIAGFVPKAAAEVFRREAGSGRILRSTELLDTALLSRLRMLKKEDFETLPDSADGAGIRLYNAVQTEPTVNGVLAAANTKRFALARLRRMLLCACLGVKAGSNSGIPPYARVLAANTKGCELLRELSEKSSIPIVTKPASVKTLEPKCGQVFALSASAHDLFTLGYSAQLARVGGEDWRKSPVIVEN